MRNWHMIYVNLQQQCWCSLLLSGMLMIKWCHFTVKYCQDANVPLKKRAHLVVHLTVPWQLLEQISWHLTAFPSGYQIAYQRHSLCWTRQYGVVKETCYFSQGGWGGLLYQSDGDAQHKMKIKPPKEDQCRCGSSLNWPLKEISVWSISQHF